MDIDLHGYHPREIVWSGVLAKVIQQVWEMGESHLCFIHVTVAIEESRPVSSTLIQVTSALGYAALPAIHGIENSSAPAR